MISIRAYDVSKKPKLKNILYDKYDNICIFKLSGLFAIKNFENILLFNKSNSQMHYNYIIYYNEF